MLRKNFSNLIVVALAMALWAGTAYAQQLVPGATTETFSYTKGGGSNSISVSPTVTDATSNTYTAGVAFDVPSGLNVWLTATPTTGTTPDTVALAGVASVLNGMAAGVYVGTVTLTGTGSDTSTATITVTLTITTPLSATTPTNLALVFVKTGGSGQGSATTTSTVSNTDASFDAYTTVPSAGCPGWLDVTSAHSNEAKASQSDTLTFSIDATGGAAAAVQSITNCSVALQYNSGTFKTVTFTSLSIVGQPLIVTNPTATLYYNKGSQTGTTATSVTVKVATGTPSTLFNLDVSTLPPWLTINSGLTNNAATATTGGDPVTFGLVTGVAGGMATGNYSAQVGFYAGSFADASVTIALQVANATPSLTELPSAETFVSQTVSMALPAPTATLYSSDEPVPFTATCTVAHTAAYTPTSGYLVPCSLNGTGASGTGSATGNVVNGTAFTWGYGMTATLDPVLFQATIGNTVTVTFTFTGVTSPPAPVVYQYTLQPGVPTITSVGPTSASANFSKTDSLVVLVKGTNFIGPGSIVGGSVVPTQVWLGTPAVLLTAANASTVGSYVVLNASQMMVTIPGNTFPTVAAGKTGTIAIGVANQTGPAAPTTPMASANLNITNSPVIYAITSTASYVQPAVGSNPAFAPFELISIFGDNFGLTGSASASATWDAFGKVVTPMVLTPAAGKVAATTLAVTFTAGKTVLTAPVLFSNQNQINLIVPSTVVVGTNYTVTVTAAGLSSDGLFTVGTVAADPAIFTLASDGTGQGAVIDQNGSINGAGHPVTANSTVSIYLAGLGVPDSTGVDVAGSTATDFPNTCVAISDTTSGSPGLLQVVNAKATGYTPPSPAWTTIDGATMSYGAHDIILGSNGDLNFPPCMATATITVTFGPANNLVTGTVTYAGFVSGSVAGLYQINAQLPASLVGVGSGSATLAGTGPQPVTVTITPVSPATTFTSQTGVTVVF
jgi:uncharacterized protein (TIGR03437 family)